MNLEAMGQKRLEFFTRGWCQFDVDPVLSQWVDSAQSAAESVVRDPDNAQWLRCGGTWFAGVNILPNTVDGAVAGGPSLGGDCIDFIDQVLGLPAFDWDKAQVSICYPGYPKPMAGETDAAFNFRHHRDAAHVDGLLPEGPDRRRFLREWHGFILAIPLLDYDRDASPFVIWEGSHEIVRDAFTSVFGDSPPDDWCSIDVTEQYHAVRRKIFDTCQRIEIVARPGEAYLVHRLALHGVAPWKAGPDSSCQQRTIAYFRPQTGGIEQWLNHR